LWTAINPSFPITPDAIMNHFPKRQPINGQNYAGNERQPSVRLFRTAITVSVEHLAKMSSIGGMPAVQFKDLEKHLAGIKDRGW
jgi:hypothetical protein